MKKTAIVVLLFSVGVSQQHHKVIETYDNGNIKSITYHEETRTKLEKVKYVKFYDDGQKKIEGTYKNGVPDGLWIYYSNGFIDEKGTYKDGKEISKIQWSYYKNGQKRSETTYEEGKAIGYKEWDRDGNLKQ